MTRIIDCLFIGYNQMDFSRYERRVRQMGKDSGAYRDLNLNFIRYNHEPYHAAEVFNLFCANAGTPGESLEPLRVPDTISTTIAYLGSYLHKRNLSFDYVNSFQDEKERLVKLLTEENILAVGVITTLYLSALPIVEIVHFIRQYNQTAKIIVGGPFVATQVRALDGGQLEHLFGSTLGADFYINSAQGETTLARLLRALKHNLTPGNINNIYYRTPTGFVPTPPSAENNRLSENIIDWGLFSPGVTGVVNIRTAISCPFSCSFCRYPELSGTYQLNDLGAIEKELDALSRIDTLKSIYFIDDTFNVPPQRFKKILRLIIKKRYPFKWHSYFRCQFADKEMIALMKESGCEGIYLGLESGNDEILKNMNKSATVDTYRRGIDLLKESGIVTFGSFIIGFPGETYETVADTVDFLEKIELDFYRIHLWYYEPVAPVWKLRDKFNIKGESYEWSHDTMNSKAAADIIDELFLSFDKSTWVPQYNFNFDNIWHLVHKGVSLDKVTRFLKGFNTGVKEKLRDPGQEEVSFKVLRQLADACRTDGKPNDLSREEQTKIDEAKAGFDFL